MKWVTVDNMYKYCNDHDVPMLSEFNAPFWNEYTSNYTRYDRLFRRMFLSYRYFMQTPVDRFDDLTEAQIEETTLNFEYDVYNHLMANAKRYTELFRINVVDDLSYSIMDNYNITETMAKETSKTGSDVYGSRTDNTSDSIGAKSDTVSEQFGQRSDSTTQNIGSRTDTNETVSGEQNNTGTNTIAGFNSDGFENDTEMVDNIGERTDTSETVVGAQSNSTNSTIGSQSNTKTTQQGAQSNSRQFTKGAQTDTSTGSGTEEYTLTRKGNIGVKTATEVMNEHKDFWSIWEFYTFIFKEICAELLLV